MQSTFFTINFRTNSIKVRLFAAGRRYKRLLADYLKYNSYISK